MLTSRRVAVGAPLTSDPGTRWEYGINTDWLGLVVESASGGMTGVTFMADQARRASMMALHTRTPDGLIVTDIDLAAEPEWMAGRHGAMATAGDDGSSSCASP